ncbi:MAG TPA: hypothetical protein DCS85_09590 [Verrucomicrobiales bacterium]|nr:hypothetical protein [Verrucomicrobiales bacterium]
MFSQKEFIEASREFVCVRLESYESEEHQKMVRSFLSGRFENTAFCILAPDGETRLSGTGRSPAQGLRQGRGNRGPNRGRGAGHEGVVDAMEEISRKYRPRDSKEGAVLQDFHSFRQGLNVASGDQRLLLYVVAPGEERDKLRKALRPLMSDGEIVGKFHTDFAENEPDAKWREAVKGERGKAGFFVIRADKFGQTGNVMAELSLDAELEELKSALLKANASFAKTEERKVYSEHVSEGRRERVYFENGMPYGEDRDGDGEIDHRGGRGAGPGADERRGPPSGRRGLPRGERRPGQPPQRPRVRPGGRD